MKNRGRKGEEKGKGAERKRKEMEG